MSQLLKISAERPSAEIWAGEFLLLQEEWAFEALGQGQPGAGRLQFCSEEPAPEWKTAGAGRARTGRPEERAKCGNVYWKERAGENPALTPRGFGFGNWPSAFESPARQVQPFPLHKVLGAKVNGKASYECDFSTKIIETNGSPFPIYSGGLEEKGWWEDRWTLANISDPLRGPLCWTGRTSNGGPYLLRLLARNRRQKNRSLN